MMDWCVPTLVGLIQSDNEMRFEVICNSLKFASYTAFSSKACISRPCRS